MKTILTLSFLFLVLTVQSQPQWLDTIDERLFLQTDNGFARSDLSGLMDLEGYYIDETPPGLLFSDDNFLFSPRLSLFLETRVGSHLYSLIQVRADRGFDPGSRPDGQIRADEYFLRYTPFSSPVLNIQAGKFATVFGSWVARHDSWENPFINAPQPYENVTIVTDQSVPPSIGAFLGRKTRPDQKGIWVPMIWGPSYASGGSIFGSVEHLDYAFEVKNAGLASRPTYWDPWEDWDQPTVTGRIGFRPDEAWNIGGSASYGGYLTGAAQSGLTGGREVSDYHQLTVGQDVSFAWHHWQVWGEAIASRFEVPNVGDADTLGYYLETKYKITPALFWALRWNQQFFEEIQVTPTRAEPWDKDAWRAESGLGYRFSRHLQSKIQYSYSHQKGGLQQGEQMVAVQVTLKF